MTDKQLYRLCKKWGRVALKARRRFAGLLPEVRRRGLWERRGFASIYEFAARLGGLSHEQVDEVLRLEQRFAEMPLLHEALVTGEVSAGKLARVAAVATAENSAEVLQMARQLTYAALDIKVKEIKTENGLPETKSATKSLCAQDINAPIALVNYSSATQKTLAELGISEQVAEKLHELKRKGLDLNQLLKEMLEKRGQEIAAEELQVQEKMEHELKDRSRYVPAVVKRLVFEKHGDKCSAGGCGRRADHLHHLREFAFGGGQDPANLRPLCRGHHELVHGGLNDCS